MKAIDRVKLIGFPVRGDERGKLIAVENDTDIPFSIRRIFYIYGSDDKVVRGQHANRRSEFVLINVAGSCKIRVTDADGETRVFVMDDPSVGLYLPTMVWKDMYDFSPDSVLLVLSNEKYDPDEYVRNFDEFLKGKTEGADR